MKMKHMLGTCTGTALVLSVGWLIYGSGATPPVEASPVALTAAVGSVLPAGVPLGACCKGGPDCVVDTEAGCDQLGGDWNEGANCNDSDQDGIPDPCDNCPTDNNAGQEDADGDGFGDECEKCPNDPDKQLPGNCGCGTPEGDKDGDGVDDCNEECDNDPDKTSPGACGCGTPDDDKDSDGVADCDDLCDNDADCTTEDGDSDGVGDCCDNCPADANADQEDKDGDGPGDACDGCPNDANKTNAGVCGCGTPDDDSDGDGLEDCIDNCPFDDNTIDTDGDSIPDCKDDCPFDDQNDVDGDGVCGDVDNCPCDSNPNQLDNDGDGNGNVCDNCPQDFDNDGPGDGGLSGNHAGHNGDVLIGGKKDDETKGRWEVKSVTATIAGPTKDPDSNELGDAMVWWDLQHGEKDNVVELLGSPLGTTWCVVANPKEKAGVSKGCCGDVTDWADQDESENLNTGDWLTIEGTACDQTLLIKEMGVDFVVQELTKCEKKDASGDIHNLHCPDTDVKGSIKSFDPLADCAQPMELNPDFGDLWVLNDWEDVGDGVCESKDNCPGVFNPNQDDTDADGVGDACDPCPLEVDNDKDGDGLCAPDDGCPNDGDKTGPGVCGCGTPDDDKDSDGVEDCIDGCPNDGNKTNAGVCGCGTPDDDKDDDGLADCIDDCPNDEDNDKDGDGVCGNEDACPNDPNKSNSAGQCGCGTPDDDKDLDGKADCVDDCPNDEDNDKDGDGFCANEENCPNDPDKTQPGDCGCGTPDIDTDKDGTADCIDDCPNDPNITSGACNDISVALVVRSEPTPFKTAGYNDGLPESETKYLTNSCFVVELWVLDVHEPKNDPGGVACVFVDVEAGDAACPLRFVKDGINFNDVFTEFLSGDIQNDPAPAAIDELGGCTLVGGVGAHAWHRLAWVEVDGASNVDGCMTSISMNEADDSKHHSSLFGKGDKREPTLKNSVDVDFNQRMSLYDLDEDKKVGPGDFGLFAPCWMQLGANGCSGVDYDCDGMIGPHDLGFFATAWGTTTSNGVVVPACQLSCSGGGTAAEETDVPWASRELIESFGLEMPPADWAGWRLAPADYPVPTRAKKPSRDVRDSRSSRR